ncbi:MAG: YihA family ribosome biogenesis GTP-binding protein [Clostridia bacterium]|nr:YihA family ribosome biogenesis GTP-binding protein [Clostridia bacterium]
MGFNNFNEVSFEGAYGKSNQIKKSTLPEIVFSGRSNVGKSSLINRLVNRRALARVSQTPGKTGTINFYALKNMKFVDLPGYGYAKVSMDEKIRWAELIEGYFSQNRKIALVVQIIDFRHCPTKLDLQMIDFLIAKGLDFVIVLIKSDKLNKTQRIKQLEIIEDFFGEKNIKYIPCSSLNGEGIKKLKGLVDDKMVQYNKS